MRALAQDPDHRYPNAEEFAVALATAAVEAFGPDWMDDADVPVHLSPSVLRAIDEASASHRATTVVVPTFTSVRPVAPDQLRVPPPRLDRTAGADLVPIQKLVPERRARWQLAALAAVLAAAAALLAFLTPGAGPDDASSGGRAGLRLAGAASPAAAHADLSEPVPVTGVGVGAGPGSHRARVTVSALGVSLGQAVSEPFTTVPGRGWSTTVNLRSWTRWVAGGAVRGRVELVPAAGAAGAAAGTAGAAAGTAPVAETEITIEPVQAPYVTAMGMGSVLLLLFAIAYLESVLRALRHGERSATGPFAAGAVGALLGFAVLLAASAFTRREPSLPVAVGCAALTAAAGVAAAVAARRTVPR
jgi:serine/threonine-protein kinase